MVVVGGEREATGPLVLEREKVTEPKKKRKRRRERLDDAGIG